jgi:hypothetical protein
MQPTMSENKEAVYSAEFGSLAVGSFSLHLSELYARLVKVLEASTCFATP